MRTGYSRFPVRAADGRFMGYLHVKDVLDLEDGDRAVPQHLWRPMATLHGGLPLNDALGAMRASASHLAAVADSAGRVLGLAALEDVLEMLVGEVHDPAHTTHALPAARSLGAEGRRGPSPAPLAPVLSPEAADPDGDRQDRARTAPRRTPA